MQRSNKKEFITKAIKIHRYKYDYSKVNYINNHSKVVIIHKECGRELEQTPNAHLAGCGCRYCYGNIKSDTKEFIKRVRKIHRYEYDYSNVKYVNKNIKVTIIHKKCGGKFLQSPHSHLSGSGCPFCYRSMKSSTLEFIKKSRKIHGYKYDYSKVNYINNHTNVIIIHKKCDRETLQDPLSHLRGGRCFFCYGSPKLTNEQFISRSKVIFGDIYDYAYVKYESRRKPVKIIHKKCGREFIQSPESHFQGQNGCHYCKKRPANLEKEFLKYCRIKNSIKNRQVKIGNYKVDGYKISTNTVYEFLGDYWHGNLNVFDGSVINRSSKETFLYLNKNTFSRIDKIRSMGYNVIYIWEQDWNNFKKGLDKKPKLHILEATVKK